jgi:thioredoxin-dependent peroxiredoxin
MKKELKVGDPAPHFALVSDKGEQVSLKQFRGKQVVLYFYPKDNTPGCTRESCDFRDSIWQIEKAGGVVLGVSLDDEASHQKFVKLYNLPFTLLCDTNAAVSKTYGVYKEKSLYGRKFWGIERTTFIIDKDGKIKQVFHKVKVDGHRDEVLEALKT